METLLDVTGMTCGHCEGRVAEALRGVPGVQAVEVNRLGGRARVEHGQETGPEQLIAAVGAIPGGRYAASKSGPAVTELRVTGMTCEHCEGRVAKALRAVSGVEQVEVSCEAQRATVRHSPGLDIQVLIGAVWEAGDGRYVASAPDAPPAPRPAEPKAAAQPAVVPQEKPESGGAVLYSIGGMTCASCAARVEQAMQKVPGVRLAAVNFARNTARVVPGPGFRPEALEQAVKDAGYSASRTLDAAESRAREGRKARLRFLVAAVAGLPVVVMGMAHWQHGWPAYLQWALATIVVFGAGGGFFVAAAKGARHGSANMDTLVALGAGAGYFFSVPALFRHGDLYFEVAAAIVALILLGKLLEAKAKGSASEAIERLAGLRPTSALKIVDGQAREVRIDEVVAGDLLLVRPGDQLPVDGEVVEGESAIDQSMLTGESMPVLRKPGDKVVGGTVNREGAIKVRATEVGAGMALSRIVRLVEEAQGSKAAIQRLADKVAGIFVPVVLVIAALTFAGWWWLGPEHSFARALFAAISVLVIACPCAMGLATPTAVMVATGRAAQLGILVKDAASLERAAGVTTVLFDKTGTLTVGEPKLVKIAALPEGDESELLAMAAAVEAESSHPLAKGIVAAGKERSVERSPVQKVKAHPGRGVEGEVRGRKVIAGTPGLLSELGVDIAPLASLIDELLGEGETPVLVAIDGKPAGALGLLDPPRPSAAEAVARLSRLGMQVHLVTGDHPKAAQAIGARLGIAADRIHAQVLPEMKARLVEELKAAGQVVAMVGDGVNDAPALAAADVGIAVGGGADVALEAAPLALMRADPLLVPQAAALAREGLKTIKQNLFWAFGYNVIAIPVAAAGLLSPMLGAGAMAFSSVSVVTNSLRLRQRRLAD